MNKRNLIILIVALIIILGIIYYNHIFNIVKNSLEKIDWSNNDIKEIILTKTTQITEQGTYKLTGTIDNGYIEINTDGNVKLLLNNVNITNFNGPAIYVKNAKSIEINTIKETQNTLIDGNDYPEFANVKACIFSQNNLILSGEGTLKIVANYKDGIISSNSLTIKGGNYIISAKKNAITVKDKFVISNGNFTIDATNDGLHSNENLKITNGNFEIKSTDDAIHADGIIEINDGNFDITASEGIEATYVKIGNGNINISATGDGINAGRKSSKYKPTIEINGGNINIKVATGDTDGVDSNGNLYINGGIINIDADSPFDYEGEAQYNGGIIVVNGRKTNTITNNN